VTPPVPVTATPVVVHTQEATAVYEYALREGGLDPGAGAGPVAAALGLPAPAVDRAIEDLRRLHLLHASRLAPFGARLVPVDPDVALAVLVSPLDEEVNQRRAAISAMRARLTAFRPHFEGVRTPRPASSELEELSDEHLISGNLLLAAQRCGREFVCLHPSRLPVDDLAARARELRARGVRVRLLLQHTVRPDIRARAQLDALAQTGTEIRTTEQLPHEIMIFDGATAILLDRHEAPAGGVVIRNAQAVRLLADIVDTTWQAAQPYAARQIGYRAAAGDLHRAIIELLAQGDTDEVVARKLGMSVRTCRRHIAVVLREFGAVSRFQAGVAAGLAGFFGHRAGRPEPAGGAGGPGRHPVASSI